MQDRGGDAPHRPGGASSVLAGQAHVRLLGPIQMVTASGASFDLPSVTQRQVLAALALERGASVRAELLCERLALSPGALRTTVSRVRGRVGVGVIATDALGYRVDCPTDAEAFEQALADRDHGVDRIATLRSALELWTGPALDEFRHEPWSEAEVFRLDELHDLAVEELAEALIEAGSGGEAVAVLQGHVTAQPLRDGARGLLVRALASVGRQAEALRAYQDYRRFLAEETGTEPSPDVVEIEQRVAAGWDGRVTVDASHGADPARLRSNGLVAVPALLTHPPEGGWVGRDAELEVLAAELGQVVGGGGARGVLVSGGEGVGKTTLAAAFGRDVHQAGQATILHGWCADGATDPLQPFRSVITALVAAAPTELLAAHARRCGGDLQRIAPAIARRTWVPPLRSTDDATDRHQLFEAVGDLLSRAADLHPMVVVLDDLHWAQPTALEMLRYLVGELGGAPILLVATVRDDVTDRSDEVRAAVADLERAGVRRLVLGGLGDGELSRLVANLVGASGPVAQGVVDALREQTAGNPLYAVQLARHLVDAGGLVVDDGSVQLAGPLGAGWVPASLNDLVWARVDALGDGAPAVLRAASVLGGSFDPQLVAALSGVPADDVHRALRSARRAGLVDEEASGHHLRFVHGLVVRSLYGELDPAERRRMHALAADLLEHGDHHRPLPVVAQLARHRALAGDRSAARRWAELAGDRSMAQLAWAEAGRWYATAVDHVRALDGSDAELAALLVKLASAQRRGGQLDLAAGSVREAAARARRSGASDLIVAAALAGDRGHVSATTLDPDQLDLVETALDLVDPADLVRRARLLAQLAQELVHTDRSDERERAARLAIDLAERSGDPALLGQLVSAISFGLWGLGSLELRAELAARAARSARRSRDPLVQFGSGRSSYLVAIESGDAQLAMTAMAQMRAVADRHGDPQLVWAVDSYDVFEATMAGELDEAEALLERTVALGLDIGEPDALAVYGGQLFVMRSFAFRYQELATLLDELVAANPGVEAFALARAIAFAATGRRDVAQEVLDAAVDAGFQPSPDHYWLTTLVGYAVLAIELGDQRAAALLYPALEPYAARATFNGATSQGPVAAYLGKLASMLGRHELADAHLHAALDMATRCGWRYHRATTLVALALSCLRATGHLDEQARRRLAEACTIAADCGLTGVAAQAASLGQQTA